MIPAKRITIERVEGYIDEAVKLTIEPGHGPGDIWQAANRILLLWSLSAPKGGAYDKCDFRVEYEDGELYQGRFDLQHWTCETPDLAKHMRRFVSFNGGLFRPAWCETEQYRTVLEDNPERVEWCARFLDAYEIGSPLKGGEDHETCGEVPADAVR